MPFDFHNRDRIDHLLEEIEELRYKDRRDLSGFCFWEPWKLPGADVSVRRM